MPTGGAYTLSEAPDRIVIDCQTCKRHGEFDRARAIQRHGDITLPDFMYQVVAPVCDRKRDITNFGGCGAVFVGLPWVG